MTIIAVQCRLSSTRLPKKALLELDGKKLISWTLDCLKKVDVDQYWLACDTGSYEVLEPIAKEHGWNCFAGPEQDVLQRYCMLAEKTGCDTILRATADNPFLFYEAAQESLVQFAKNDCDYFSFTGLPHGSGIEVFSAKALLKARDITSDPYDHEHVGPSLYNHKENFNSIFIEAPFKWTNNVNNDKNYRTTIDTKADYRYACRVIEFLKSKDKTAPYRAEDIFLALESPFVNIKILVVPCVKKGHGTGHMRRMLNLIERLQEKDNYADVFVTEKPSKEVSELLYNAAFLEKHNVIAELPQKNEYGFIVTDSFSIDSDLLARLQEIAPICAIDEGNTKTDSVDYILNSIPSLFSNDSKNAYFPQFIDLPEQKPLKKQGIKKVLISIGGEDPAQFSEILDNTLTEIGKKCGFTVDNTKKQPIKNLKETLYQYDVVCTHYGITAFEAVRSGCALILVATSPIHKKLSKKYNCICLDKKDCTEKKLMGLLENPAVLYNNGLLQELTAHYKADIGSFEDFIIQLSHGKRYVCPVCGKKDTKDSVISRDIHKTVKRCSVCNICYISYCTIPEKTYTETYFFDEYKNQYGKTYLEDFEAIKAQGIRRIENILPLVNTAQTKKIWSLLDVGCAYGPFLSAAKDAGFIPTGTDVSEHAVTYVKEELGFNALCADFYTYPTDKHYDVVTLWYVIEHFQNLDTVLQNVSELLPNGGVFAFSTPNSSGISARKNKKLFFKQSPYDHFSIWSKSCLKNVLTKYDFHVKKIVTTGIHKERFPLIFKFLPDAVFTFIAKKARLGDTFEIYCVKDTSKH